MVVDVGHYGLACGKHVGDIGLQQLNTKICNCVMEHPTYKDHTCSCVACKMRQNEITALREAKEQALPPPCDT